MTQAIRRMELLDTLPFIEKNCNRDICTEEGNCPEHQDVLLLAMVLMELRSFTKAMILATKKVNGVVSGTS